MKEYEEHAERLTREKQSIRELIEQSRQETGRCYRRREFGELLGVVHQLCDQFEDFLAELEYQ